GTDMLTSCMMDFENGQASVTASTQVNAHQKVEILGSDGKIVITPPFNVPVDVPAVLTCENSDGFRELECEIADQYGLQFEAFSTVIREGGVMPISDDEAINNMKAIDALFRSEKSGSWETV
ncbi:Gfo/Idh/MocA family oxidoreductase, partial [Candidatus Latescibacterota bacterium]